MGLDVRGFEIAKFVRAQRDNDDEEEGLRLLWRDSNCADRSDGLPDGLYRVSGKTVNGGSRPYSSYSRWRADLAQMLGTTDKAIWTDPKPGPFVELINYSDCEGFFGPKTCAKLAEDFAAWRQRAESHFANPRDLEFYNSMSAAFACAAGNGVVRFS